MRTERKLAEAYVDKIRYFYPFTNIVGSRKDRRRKAFIRAFITFGWKFHILKREEEAAGK